MRRYTAEERAEAVALAVSIGPMRAADQLGFPRRTVNFWCHRPAASPIIAEAEASIAQRLESAASLGIDGNLEAIARLRQIIVSSVSNPSEVAHAARALNDIFGTTATQANLATGRATARTENTNLSLEFDAALSAMDPVVFRTFLAQLAATNGENPVDSVIEALRRLSPAQRDELEARIAEADAPLAWHEEDHGMGRYGRLPDGSELYFSDTDPRWQTGEIVPAFDWQRGPSRRLTDGQ